MRVLKVVFSGKWLLRHLLAVLAIAACIFLGKWQWNRAMASDGTLQNLFYAFNWWIFAALVVYGWGRTLRDELARDEVVDTDPGQPAQPPIALPALYRKQRPAELDAPIEDDPELVAYNAYLAQLNERSNN